jgi:DNA-damage-inducible protein J
VTAIADTYVRARIDTATKDRAEAALRAMGLSTSEAIRLLLVKVANEQRLPFDVSLPNSATRAAMSEAEAIVRKRRPRFATSQDVLNALEEEARGG